MNDTLKVAGRIGAELGAAKAENERLRGLLQGVLNTPRGTSGRIILEPDEEAAIRAALSQQPEPTDTYTAVDMGTAAAQEFRDGQAAVEPAPAQDERDSVIAHIELCITNLKAEHQTNPRVIAEVLYNIGYSRAAPIAQTAPQPEQSGLPQELFDGYAVYQETVRYHRDKGLLVRTSAENVSDTLDAVARLIKARRAALSAQG